MLQIRDAEFLIYREEHYQDYLSIPQTLREDPRTEVHGRAENRLAEKQKSLNSSRANHPTPTGRPLSCKSRRARTASGCVHSHWRGRPPACTHILTSLPAQMPTRLHPHTLTTNLPAQILKCWHSGFFCPRKEFEKFVFGKTNCTDSTT